MRKYTAVILVGLLSGSIFEVIAAPTTSLPPAPPPSAFIHSINAHPASVNVKGKTLKHSAEVSLKKKTRNRQEPEKGRNISRNKWRTESRSVGLMNNKTAAPLTADHSGV